MSEPRDGIDDWLNREVEPLPPPPGTFERISRRARGRKARRAALSAAGVAVVIGVAAAAPGIVSAVRGGTGQPAPPVAANSPRATAQPTVSGQGSGGVSSQSSSPVGGESTPASLLNQDSLVPKNFQPTSVTFIGLNTGAVIGQAGTQGHCASRFCTSLAGTADYGQTWFGVSAPRTGAPDGASGVGQLRFLNTHDGWAFGPQLWATDDGGASWKQEPTDGMRVTDLETANGHAFALFASCTGTGAEFGVDCSHFSLFTSVAGTDQWQRVPGPTANLPQAGTGQPGSASLVLAGSRGYLLAPSGEVLSGPLTGAAWTIADVKAPCVPGPPGPGGQPTGALLAAGSGKLFLVCNSATNAAGDSQTKIVMQSSNGGVSWSTAGDTPSVGTVTSVAAAQGNIVVLATDSGLYLSDTGGASWHVAASGPTGAAAEQRGFSYVGMTSNTNGVALPADPDLGEVFITTDGGSSWRPHSVSSS